MHETLKISTMLKMLLVRLVLALLYGNVPYICMYAAVNAVADRGGGGEDGDRGDG